MSNTYSADLVPDRIADRVITVLTARLAPLSAFTTDFGIDPLHRHATVQVPLASVDDDARQDPTDFEVGDSLLGAAPVVVQQVNKSFHCTNLEVQKGFRLEQVAEANANRFADSITALAMHPLQTVGYSEYSGNAVAPDSFGVAEAKQVWGEMFGPGPSNLILARAYAANLQPSDRNWFDMSQGAYGFDRIYTNELWSTTIVNATPTQVTVGAPAGLVGIACHPQAIALASGAPTNLAVPEGEFWDNRMLTLSNGMSVQMVVWFSRQTRNIWASLDVMFGAAAGDMTAGSLVAIGDSNYTHPSALRGSGNPTPPPATQEAVPKRKNGGK